MSKKLFSLFLTAVLAASILLCFAACGTNNQPEVPDTTLATQQDEELIASVQNEAEEQENPEESQAPDAFEAESAE